MRVAIVGAGITGLVAAQELQAAGVDTVVFDKAPIVGGRLATRHVGGAVCDTGAQFFTVRTPAFESRVRDWESRGLVSVWNFGFAPDYASGTEHADGFERYCAVHGMASLAADLASGVEVRCESMVFSIAVNTPRDGERPDGIVVTTDDGVAHHADAVIVTTPLPQTFALIAGGGVELSAADERLLRTDYDRTIALLVELDQPALLPRSGGVQHPDSVFSFIGDNSSKRLSAVPAVTFHANAAWSLAHWNEPVEELVVALTDTARPWVGDASIVASSIKKWRFATPQTVFPDPSATLADGRIVLAGDAFAGPKVEGAHNSGLAAAHTLLA